MLALIPMLNIYRARYRCYMLKMSRLFYTGQCGRSIMNLPSFLSTLALILMLKIDMVRQGCTEQFMRVSTGQFGRVI